jgi:hypothetical protein
MEKTIKFMDKKIITKTQYEDRVLIETWEAYPNENDPKKEYITHNNLSYYLKSRKEK